VYHKHTIYQHDDAVETINFLLATK